MKYVFYMTDTKNNFSGVYHEEFDWKNKDHDGNAEKGMLFQWLENNYACDCNRSMFLYDDWETDFDCGDTILLTKIEDSNGTIIYNNPLGDKK